jgi:hypothetical protein
MKRISITVLTTIVLFLSVVYFLNKDKLPSRTPYKIARNISGLKLINRGYKIQQFEERWNNFNGDGYALILFSLTKNQYKNIYNKCISMNYDTLPFYNFPNYNILNNISNKGLYKLDYYTSQKCSFKLTVLDKKNKKLLIMMSVD